MLVWCFSSVDEVNNVVGMITRKDLLDEVIETQFERVTHDTKRKSMSLSAISQVHTRL